MGRAATGSATQAPCIVLDTNVWLDLLVFDDPRTGALRAALEARRVVAVTDGDCRDEWVRVLGYPLLRLDHSRREAMTAAFDALAHPLLSAARQTEPTLPRCRDPDDQKFLQLARDAGARWLLSRDRHLLSLAPRCRREGRFEIATPEAWAASAPL
jgi:putative PIN family toxin of toxin-antitoxin system